MVFGKKTHLIGLDIGSRSIKAGEVVDSKKGRTLRKFGMVELADGIIEEGAIKDPEAAATSIKELFKEYNFRDQNVAISIGGYSVIVKKITVQTMTDDQLQDTIQFEAEQYIPFDINDVNLDFQILGESENNPNQMSVLLVAAKKEMIEEYINLIRLAGLNPCLIDIGASKTSLNILKGTNSVFMRDVSLGCGQINQKIVSLVDCTVEEAEQIKQSDQSDSISPEDLREIISSVVADWCSEIRRALDFFYSTEPDEQIDKIVLSGGGANIAEFRSLLAAETSTDVEIVNPFKNFIIDESGLDSSYLELVAPQAAICMGLSLREVDDK